MKKIKNILVCISMCSLFAGAAAGQSLGGDYRAAIGLRVGETSGISFKLNTGNASGFELIAGMWSDWLNLTGLYERKMPAFKIEGMKWYYGGGGHIAFVTGTYYNEGRYYNRGDDFAMGIDGIIGLEYKIPEIPFAVSLDLKPLMEIYRTGNLYFSIDPGIGVKFTF